MMRDDKVYSYYENNKVIIGAGNYVFFFFISIDEGQKLVSIIIDNLCIIIL